MSMRCFTAVLLPQSVRHAIAEMMREQIASMQGAGIAPPRPEAEENLHCTVNFFGSVEEARAVTFFTDARRALESFGAFDLSIGTMGAFSGRGAARVMWVGVDDRSGQLSRVRAVLSASAEACGMPADESAGFRPHITTGRWKNNGPRETRLQAEGFAPCDFGTVRVEAIALMRSVSGASGPVYTEVGSIALQAV